MSNLDTIGCEWLEEEVEDLTEEVGNLLPSEYNEQTRYLPRSVTSKPGYIRYKVNPFMREIVDCAAVDSPVREINLMKGVQITYSTALESIILYYADYIGTLPMMYITADKELAHARIENNFIPMIQQSELSHIIQSSDQTSSQKTGKTKDHIQFAKGAYLVPFGAKNADKMRSFSIAIMAKDEVDAWPQTVGKDGDPDALSDSRTDGYPDNSKIFRGSTPLVKGLSIIEKNFKKGDQRRYFVPCRGCGHMQYLMWRREDKETGVVSGFLWDYHEDGSLDRASVRYECEKCGHAHYEHDKEWMFSRGEWRPTATSIDPTIRSYHLPALYSPIGMRAWAKNVLQWLECYDVKNERVIDAPKFQVFYNNVLAEAYEVRGSKITFVQASMHRRSAYRQGEVPNNYAAQYAGTKILFLTCQIDVHKSNLAVSVMGWTAHLRCFVIMYERWHDEDCTQQTSPVWQKVRDIIEKKIYTADDGAQYRVLRTFIDASYENALVVSFCSEYTSGVYPILGRDRPGKNQTIKEFSEFKTQAGTLGYKIVVDHYKDRLAPVLRHDWQEEIGEQPRFHFNAPVDLSDKAIKELTVEVRREKTDDKGATTQYWHRPGNAPNELWDLLNYGHAAVESMAWAICIQHFEMEKFEWAEFWQFAKAPEHGALFGRLAD